jgi:hypothetical protein
MLKAIFIIGQCIRALHTDPWQSTTYQITTVGNYSYRIIQVDEDGFHDTLNPKVLSFGVQKDFEVVDCPKGL